MTTVAKDFQVTTGANHARVMRVARILRATVRLAALCAATAFACVVLFAGLPFASLSRRASRRWRAFLFRTWARTAALIIGMKSNTRGHAPKPPFLLVANHLSYVDVVALAARADCVFVAKSEVAGWPVVGRLCRVAKTIFVNRRSRREIPAALSLVERALDERAGVVLFAEGTSTRGTSVRPFKSPLLEAAARRAMPVHYASLSYRTQAGEPSARNAVCWSGDMTFPKHFFELLQMKGFCADISFGEGALRSVDRKALACELWAAVSARFVPVA
ncbi:MAG: 1-acyl-sn-glycerol-3-phosphate acyltransferase [Rubrivivax sp.]|nr:1-acyl-sn-glycerol-3-phosphate acyltransferase [Pyrinomonadaceae bacterium]